MLIDESAVIKSQLAPGKQLFWSGRPRQGFFFRGSDALVIPFSLLWCGFAIFWEATVWALDTPLFFRLWGIPFVIAGLYFVFGRFVVDIWQRRKTYYGVSNERIIFVSGLSGRTIKSLSLISLTDITLKEHAKGSGSIVFNDPINSIEERNYISTRKQRPAPPTFEQIPKAKIVYELIRNAQNRVNRSLERKNYVENN